MDSQYFNVELIEELYAGRTPREQYDAVLRLAMDDSIDPSFLMQPFGKGCWKNAALVLLARGASEMEHYIPELLDWIRDTNWPGAMIVFELLSHFPPEKLQPYIQRKMREAELRNNEVWIDNLYNLQDKKYRYGTIIGNHMINR